MRAVVAKVALAAVAATLAATTAQARQAAPAQAVAPPKAIYEEITAAPLDQELASPSGLQIETGEDGAKLILRYGRAKARLLQNADGDGYFDTLGITVTAPLNDDADWGKTASLDSLARAATLEAAWSTLQISRPPRAQWVQVAKDEDALCRAIISRLSSPAREKAQTDHDDNGCTDAFVAEYEPASLDAFLRLHWGDKPMMRSYGLSARTGRVSLDYLDLVTIAERSVEKTAWSVKGFYAMRPLHKPWLVLFAVEHQDGYEAQDEKTLCPPGVIECVTGAYGAPAHVVRTLISAEARRSFKDFSASVSLTYDPDDDLYAVELPLYVTRDGGGAPLNSGIKLNWRSDTDELVASVFVGKAFSLGWN